MSTRRSTKTFSTAFETAKHQQERNSRLAGVSGLVFHITFVKRCHRRRVEEGKKELNHEGLHVEHLRYQRQGGDDTPYLKRRKNSSNWAL